MNISLTKRIAFDTIGVERWLIVMANELVIRGSKELPQAAPSKFEDFVALWFDSDSMFRVREQSKRSYRKSLKAFTDWLDAQGIAQPTKQDVKDWCKAMDAAKFSTATKNLRLTTVRNFYKWLASEYGVANIAEGLKGWKETKEHRRGFLSCEEMKRLLAVVNADTLQGKRDKAILAVMMTAGLRTIEISRLHVGDVQHNGGVCYLEVLGKGRDDTEAVKLSRKAEQLIRDWLAAREAVDIVSDDSPLFCSLSRNSFGEVLSSNSVSTLTKGYLEAAGLKTKAITAHSLRHSMATNSLLKGASLMEVQQQLRHANLSTSQIYLHEAEKSQNRCTDFVADEIL